jgi:DNA ligase-1
VKAFARLFEALDETTRTNEKVAAMVSYLRDAAPADAAWAIHFLSGNRPKRLIGARKLAAWAMEEADIAPWLFEECYESTGDLAETIALLLPAPVRDSDLPLHQWVEQRLMPLAKEAEDVQRLNVIDAWRELDGTARLVWTKLITGGFRVGVSKSLVVRAIAEMTGVPDTTIAHRLMGAWTPDADSWARLLAQDTQDADRSRPYPFFLAYALDEDPSALGDVADWQIEWKWDGIRAQVIRRHGCTYVWSRGEQSMSDRFPEIEAAAALLPDGTVIDGEVMPWRDDQPLPFAQLQRRIGRTRIGPKILNEVPVILIAYDLLEYGGEDIRDRPLSERRRLLESIIARHSAGGRLRISTVIGAPTWDAVRDLQRDARLHHAEGLMLKRRDSAYGAGRRRGGWWKWKVSPLTVDAVMIYAQAGHGRRASLFTDYTFAVWRGDELVPFAKAYSGLTDEEIRRLDNWIKRSTVERFGPVRSVKPEQVFEIGFEGIQHSSRHKSGVAVRFPRILRWRADKTAADADSLDTLRGLADAS